jgi:arylsulfatase A-like enzyme
MADQMRGDCLSADGHPVVETPHLDHLAATGSRFEHAYTAVPSCLPARSILMTGMNQWHTGVLGMGRGQGAIPNDFPHTLGGELVNAGYQTHLVGKGHFSGPRAYMGFQSRELDESGRLFRDGEQDGYRAWFEREAKRDITPDDHGVDWNSWIGRPWHTEEHLHPTAWTMSRAMEFIAHRDTNRPFFLNISFARPHSPYVPPAPYFDMYDRGDTPPPHVGEWSEMHDRSSDASSDASGDASNVNAWRGKLSAERIHRGRAGYYGEISFIDTQIGRLRNRLGRYHPDVAANTWIIFLSDHGDMVGDHHLWRKTYAYEGSARIPFIVAPPPNQRGRVTQGVVDQPVEIMDIMPTILDAAGVDLPPTVDGKSVLPLMEGDSDGWREYVHGEHCTCYSPEQEMQYVTDGHKKLVWLPRLDRVQFFDLDADSGECTDLADDPNHADDVTLWSDRLVAELQARDCGWAQDGGLSCLPEPLVSPYRDRRYVG